MRSTWNLNLEHKLGIYSVSPGIEVTLENMPDYGVILVVTDAGTHQRELEDMITKKSAEKNIKIFIAFSPKCMAPTLCSRSMPSTTGCQKEGFSIRLILTAKSSSKQLFTRSEIMLR